MNDNDPRLVVLVGYPRSGKSTIVRDWYIPHGYAAVCPDIIRHVVRGRLSMDAMEHYAWSVVYIMADSLLFAGNKVVVDGTHISRHRRENWVKRGAVFHYVPTPVEVCLKRAASQANACDIIPVINKMAGEFEPLGEGEIEWQPDQMDLAAISAPR